MMRPRPARWFEALVARDDATLLLGALAATGAVELEARGEASLPEAFAAARPGLARFAEFRRRTGAYWPKGALVPSTLPESPAATLEAGLGALEAWSAEAEPHIRRAQAQDARRLELERWRPLLAPLRESRIDAALLESAGPIAHAALVQVADDVELQAPGAIVAPLPGAPGHRLALAPAAAMESLAREAASHKGRVLPLPADIAAMVRGGPAFVDAARADLDREAREARAALDALSERHGLHTRLADLSRLEWVLGHVRALEAGERFAWITGWTSDAAGATVREAADRCGARALLHFPPAPRGLRPPLLFSNPRWARPFELFPRALGMPAGTEADPTVILAIAVPLIFGYMFGDVGQGLVVAIAGWSLRKRLPVGRLLAVGGASAALFGLAFGSVFSVHGAMRPWWTDPLAEPIAVLAAPIAAGAVLLALGLALRALGSWWRGEPAVALGEDLGLLVLYAGAGLAIVDRAGWIVAAAGLAMVVGGRVLHEGRAMAALGALGELLERGFQLAVNTLSFARVGAFALAHAGLSSAVSALAHEAGGGIAGVAILVLGNLFVIALEALLVSIQATRLVLFEFFSRFLTGAGRAFRPLPPPPYAFAESP